MKPSPLAHLYMVIISTLLLLSSSDGMPKVSNLSSYDKPCRLGTHLVTAFCTLSSFEMFFVWVPYYSSIFQTWSEILGNQYFNHLFIRVAECHSDVHLPCICFAICVFNVPM